MLKANEKEGNNKINETEAINKYAVKKNLILNLPVSTKLLY